MKGLHYLLFLLLICLNWKVQAAHIIGGDVVYQCNRVDSNLRRTTFDITFTMYRDSEGGGARFDNGAAFGLFKSNDGGITWDLVNTITANPTDIRKVDYDSPCIILPPNIGVERATYAYQVTLDWGNFIYQIAYQRCCRNGTISNIVNPGSTGAAFILEIYADAISSCNNSPKFKNFPPTVICLNTQLKFDHSASDKEGDQLVYEFCAPKTAGGRDGENGGDATGCNGVRPSPLKCSPPFEDINFVQPLYSSSNPMSGSVPITIDPVTGLISGVPNISGQYVVGVCVKEFRNGKLIGQIRRDFQFNVTQCQIAVDALIDIDNKKVLNGYVEIKRKGNGYSIKSCGSSEIPFTNKSIQESNIKGYKWVFDNGIEKDSFIDKDLNYKFKTLGKYAGQLIVNPGLSDCADTALLDIEIFPNLKADLSFKYDTCVAGPIDFKDLSTSVAPIIKREWIFNRDTLLVQDPSYTYTTPGKKDARLRITDSNRCINEVSKTISYFPVPALLVIEPTQFVGCLPANIKFLNLSTPIDTSYTINWDFGDGKTSNKISPTHQYEQVGVYNVKIDLKSPIGCTTSRSYGQWIEVLESPIANFSYTPQSFNGVNKTATFTNLSSKEIGLLWDFGGKGSSSVENPVYTFPDTGLYKVVLLAIHESGCTDTASALIDIIPLASLDMPNAFTPNNDGLNDDFKGYGNLDGIKNYKLSIWNRWGAKIFESIDPLIGWTGEKDNEGLLLPQDVYVYLVEYLSPRGKLVKYKGQVTLVR
jgi:gliding motility-associated-like protein